MQPTARMPWVKAKVVREHFGVSNTTLQNWERAGKIKTVRTPGGIRLFDLDAYLDAQANPPTQDTDRPPVNNGVDIAYCRVSSAKQQPDLKRQIEYMREKCPGAKIVTDVGSGINFKRKGLRSILDRVLQGRVRSVTVAHRDRLCRFGFELIQWILQRQQVQLVVLNDVKASPEHEFTEDLLAIVHVFSCRFNGLRRYKRAATEATEGRVAKQPRTSARPRSRLTSPDSAMPEDSDSEDVETSEEDSE